MLALKTLPLGTLMFVFACANAPAQQAAPFGDEPKPAATSDNPFGDSTPPQPALDDPFGDQKPPAPALNDPFGNPKPAVAAPNDPFGGGAPVRKEAAAPNAKPAPKAKPAPEAPPEPKAQLAPKRDAVQSNEANDRIRQVLLEETTVEFYDTPMGEVAEIISMDHQIPVLIDTRAFEEIGISSDVPVDLILKNVSLRSALKLMLAPLGCTYIVKDEVLQITTVEKAEKSLVLRSYKMDEELAPRGEKILKALITTVATPSWAEAGGPCSVSVIDNVLVVSATEAVHEQVENFMRMLADAFAKKAKQR